MISTQHPDGTCETWTAAGYQLTDSSGAVVYERPLTTDEAAVVAAAEAARSNEQQVITAARAAYVTLGAYVETVATGSATNADHLAAVPVLARAVRGLIRLTVRDLLEG